MKPAAFALAALVVGGAALAAQPAPPAAFDTVNCFTWNGGVGSSGSHSKCAAPYYAPAPVQVVTVDRIVQLPPVILEPECPVASKPRAAVKKQYIKPRPKLVCPVPLVPKS